MNLLSYWSDIKNAYTDGGFVVIYGYYNKNSHTSDTKGDKTLAIHWGKFPYAQREDGSKVLSPCIVHAPARAAKLTGLLNQAIIANEIKRIKSLSEAIQFFTNEE